MLERHPSCLDKSKAQPRSLKATQPSTSSIAVAQQPSTLFAKPSSACIGPKAQQQSASFGEALAVSTGSMAEQPSSTSSQDSSVSITSKAKQPSASRTKEAPASVSIARQATEVYETDQEPCSLSSLSSLMDRESISVLKEYRRKSKMPELPKQSLLPPRKPMEATRSIQPLGSQFSFGTTTTEEEGEEVVEEAQRTLESSQKSRTTRNTGTYKKPSKVTIGFYKPATQTVLERAKLFIRGEIVIVDAFPDARAGGKSLAQEVITYALEEAQPICGNLLASEGVLSLLSLIK